MRLSDSGGCFGCGPNNPIGLHLEFRAEGEEYVTEFLPTTHHQGFDGIVHGGILATVLDEVMARQLWVRDVQVVTAEMKVSLHRPALVGERLMVSGRVTRDRGRLILSEATARREDGTLVASAEAKMMRVTIDAEGGKLRVRGS